MLIILTFSNFKDTFKKLNADDFIDKKLKEQLFDLNDFCNLQGELK